MTNQSDFNPQGPAMETAISFFSRLSCWTNCLAKYILFALLICMTGIVFVAVVMRYVFNHSIVWSEEVARYAFVWTSFLGASVASQQGAHIGVRLIVDKLPRRARLISEVLINLIVLVFLLSGFYTGVQMSIRSWHQMTAVMEISMTLPYLAIPTGCLFMFIQQLDILVRLLFSRDSQRKAYYSSE